MPFRAIDGRVLERDMGVVYIASDGRSVPDLVVMAEEGESEVMGAQSIEGLGMAADPVQSEACSNHYVGIEFGDFMNNCG